MFLSQTTTPRRTLATSSFSFYLRAKHAPKVMRECADLGDALTIAGLAGPKTVGAVFGDGPPCPILFDAEGYRLRTVPIDAPGWFDAQARAGADRLLTPGMWVSWDANDIGALERHVSAEYAVADEVNDATVLIAIDSRWLRLGPDAVNAVLGGVDKPVALVLSHGDDPLGVAGVLDGLLSLLAKRDDISLLRTDHGGLGAITFGAAHASIGLTSSTRHLFPPGGSGRRKHWDDTCRVFVGDLLDWFTAGEIAGWTAEDRIVTCEHECCAGQRLDRFFDPADQLDADRHNAVALARLADDLLGQLDVPAHDAISRYTAFARLCRAAVARYDEVGREPKKQLSNWAQRCGA